MNGDAGDEVIPAGSPSNAICPLPVKPFRASTDSIIAELVLPCANCNVLG